MKRITFVKNKYDMFVRHLKNREIDFEQWDACVLSAGNSVIYAQSWYLNLVSPNWEALVYGDYEYVMPLPFKEKLKVRFLVQPTLAQQLGVFSKCQITREVLDTFIKRIPSLSYDLNFNTGNFLPKAKAFPNFMLNLKEEYDCLREKYSKNARRNIKTAMSYGLVINSELSLDEFMRFYYEKRADERYSKPSKELVERLLLAALNRNSVSLYGVFSSVGTLIAALALFKTKGRLTYLLPCSSVEGKRNAAMFLLVDEIIRNYASSEMFLDFEGSRIEGIARFYQAFGAENYPYYQIERLSVNRLLRKIRWRRK